MEDLPLGRIAALVPEFAVKDMPLGRTLMMILHKIDPTSELSPVTNNVFQTEVDVSGYLSMTDK